MDKNFNDNKCEYYIEELNELSEFEKIKRNILSKKGLDLKENTSRKRIKTNKIQIKPE